MVVADATWVAWPGPMFARTQIERRERATVIEPHPLSGGAETKTADTAPTHAEVTKGMLLFHPLSVPRLKAMLADNLQALDVAVAEAAQSIEGAIDLLAKHAMELGAADLSELHEALRQAQRALDTIAAGSGNAAPVRLEDAAALNRCNKLLLDIAARISVSN